MSESHDVRPSREEVTELRWYFGGRSVASQGSSFEAEVEALAFAAEEVEPCAACQPEPRLGQPGSGFGEDAELCAGCAGTGVVSRSGSSAREGVSAAILADYEGGASALGLTEDELIRHLDANRLLARCTLAELQALAARYGH